MFNTLGRDLRTVVIAVVAASVVAGPAAAAAVYVANADRVDNRHAVGAGATVNARKGKLVATNGTSGRLPNNIIATAPNANRLDGMDSSELGMNGYQRVRVQGSFNSTAHKVVNADCPEGTRVTGGGAEVFPSLADASRDSAPIVIRWSAPSPGDDGWSVIADETLAYGFDWWVAVTAICAA